MQTYGETIKGTTYIDVTVSLPDEAHKRFLAACKLDNERPEDGIGKAIAQYIARTEHKAARKTTGVTVNWLVKSMIWTQHVDVYHEDGARLKLGLSLDEVTKQYGTRHVYSYRALRPDLIMITIKG